MAVHLQVPLPSLVQRVVKPSEDVLIVHARRCLKGGSVEAHGLGPDPHHIQVVGHSGVHVASNQLHAMHHLHVARLEICGTCQWTKMSRFDVQI